MTMIMFLFGFTTCMLTGGFSVTLYCMWREYGRRRVRRNNPPPHMRKPLRTERRSVAAKKKPYVNYKRKGAGCQ